MIIYYDGEAEKRRAEAVVKANNGEPSFGDQGLNIGSAFPSLEDAEKARRELSAKGICAQDPEPVW